MKNTYEIQKFADELNNILVAEHKQGDYCSAIINDSEALEFLTDSCLVFELCNDLAKQAQFLFDQDISLELYKSRVTALQKTYSDRI